MKGKVQKVKKQLDGLVDQGIIFPVSASILDHITDYRLVLQSYSKPLLEFIKWKETSNHNISVVNNTKDFYNFFVATKQAEFLYDCVEDTVLNLNPKRAIKKELSMFEQNEIKAIEAEFKSIFM